MDTLLPRCQHMVFLIDGTGRQAADVVVAAHGKSSNANHESTTGRKHENNKDLSCFRDSLWRARKCKGKQACYEVHTTPSLSARVTITSAEASPKRSRTWAATALAASSSATMAKTAAPHELWPTPRTPL